MRNLRLIIGASLLISIGLLFSPVLLGLFETPPEEAAPAVGKPPGYYDYYIEDLVMIGIDNSGLPYRLTAKRMERYGAEDRSELFEPFFSQEQSDPPRTIRADRGRLSHRETLLDLQDNVILIRHPSDGGRETTTSQRMQIKLK